MYLTLILTFFFFFGYHKTKKVYKVCPITSDSSTAYSLISFAL